MPRKPVPYSQIPLGGYFVFADLPQRRFQKTPTIDALAVDDHFRMIAPRPDVNCIPCEQPQQKD